MTTNEEHHEALYSLIKEAVSSYRARHGSNVRVDVLQAALGEVIAESFDAIPSATERTSNLESFCALLREAVDMIDHDTDAPSGIIHKSPKRMQ